MYECINFGLVTGFNSQTRAGQGHKWRALTASYSGGAQNVLSRRADNGISFVPGPTWRTERRALTASYSGGAQNVLVLGPPTGPSNVRPPLAPPGWVGVVMPVMLVMLICKP